MKIESFGVRNIGKLSDVRFNIKKNTIIISGDNGRGKTTVLDTICRTFGLQPIPESPIKEGELKASEVITLDDMIVTRKYMREHVTGPIKTRLEVETKDGEKLKKPKELLKGLVGEFLDPAAAMNMTEREQLKLFMKIADVDFDIESHEKERSAFYTERTVVSRNAKRQGAVLADMDYPEEIPEKVSVLALIKEKDRLDAENKAILNNRRFYNSELGKIEESKATIKDLKEYIEAVEATLIEQNLTAESIDGMVIQDTSNISQKISDAENENEKRLALVNYKAKYNHRQNEVAEVEEESKDLTEQINELDRQQIVAFANANIPVKDLAVKFKENGKAALFRGNFPLVKGSTAEKIETWLQILMSTKPKLKVVLVDSAERLDPDNLALIDRITKENGYMVFMTIVGSAEGEERQILVLKDGTIQ